jgi:hypothetical protein
VSELATIMENRRSSLGCTRCGRGEKTVAQVSVQIRALDELSRARGPARTHSRSLCDGCAVFLWNQFNAMLDAAAPE